jgi:hypothetical protein
MNNVLRMCGSLVLGLVVACGSGAPADGAGSTESAMKTDPPATSEVCGPPAKILRWITPFSASDATDQVLSSDVGTWWKVRLRGPASSEYLAWAAGVAALMKVFADSTNPTPSEPYETRGVIALRNVRLSCENGVAQKVTYDVDRNPGYTPLINSLLDIGAGGRAYHIGEEQAPADPPPSYSGGSATISVMEKSRLAPPGQWGWTMLLGYGMPWIWEKIDYTISCDGSATATGSGSAFPSARFTFGSQSKEWMQNDLVGFIRSGLPHDYDSLSPPGGDAPQGFSWTLSEKCTSSPCAYQGPPPAPYLTNVGGYDVALPSAGTALAPVIITAANGIDGIVNGTDKPGDPSRLTHDEQRGKYCGGSDDGREVVRHSDSNYISYTPAFEDCRACCEADPQVTSLTVCMNACKLSCATCGIGSTTDLPPPATYTCARGAVLSSGQQMGGGDMICAPGGKCAAIMQGDGNFVVYNNGRAIWASNTMGTGGSVAMQTDCNLVVYPPTAGAPAVWASDTAGRANGCRVQIQDDCNLVIYDAANNPIWASQ